jgi:hypothetical protein
MAAIIALFFTCIGIFFAWHGAHIWLGMDWRKF